MLFMGQEWSASSPFLFFADHEPELAALVRQGRLEFLSQFPSIVAPEVRATLADPGDPTTFERCRLDWSERARNREAWALHCDLLRLRREDPVFSHPRHGGVDGAVLGDGAFLLRYFGTRAGDRLLAINLGGPHHRTSVAEPLLAPPAGTRWMIRWTSDDPRYGGPGLPLVDAPDESWYLPPECAVLFKPLPHNPAPTLEERARA
jgi:maltooligosyltrehalose trehalohydrolase